MPRVDANITFSMAGTIQSAFIKNRPNMFSTFGNTLNTNKATPSVWHTSTIRVFGKYLGKNEF